MKYHITNKKKQKMGSRRGFSGIFVKISVKSRHNSFDRFCMQGIYGKEVLHDFLRFLVQKIRQLLISGEKQDGVEKNKMAPKMAAKLTLRDNILQWEHQNSYTRDNKGHKNISQKNISFGWSRTLLPALLSPYALSWQYCDRRKPELCPRPTLISNDFKCSL